MSFWRASSVALGSYIGYSLGNFLSSIARARCDLVHVFLHRRRAASYGAGLGPSASCRLLALLRHHEVIQRCLLTRVKAVVATDIFQGPSVTGNRHAANRTGSARRRRASSDGGTAIPRRLTRPPRRRGRAELGRLIDRQVGRLLALENPCGMEAGPAIGIGEALLKARVDLISAISSRSPPRRPVTPGATRRSPLRAPLAFPPSRKQRSTLQGGKL